MTELYLKYNPYIVETEMRIDGELVVPPNRLADWKNERLQIWVENLM